MLTSWSCLRVAGGAQGPPLRGFAPLSHSVMSRETFLCDNLGRGCFLAESSLQAGRCLSVTVMVSECFRSSGLAGPTEGVRSGGFSRILLELLSVFLATFTGTCLASCPGLGNLAPR